MFHKPIQIKDLELSFPHKICFNNFNCQINYGHRIAIIGRNGSGKTTLLKMIYGEIMPESGVLKIPEDVVFGYVPQTLVQNKSLSGGQQLNEAITKALSLNPNILLLDEPTNHLDILNKKSLIRMLQNYNKTLIVVSHDTALLRQCIDTFWYIDNGKITIFSGSYDDYMDEIHVKRQSIEAKLSRVVLEKKEMHQKLMKEQERASKSREKGQKGIKKDKWPSIIAQSKSSSAQENAGQKTKEIHQKKYHLNQQLNSLRIPEIIIPRFSITGDHRLNQTVVQISDGCLGYSSSQLMLSNINMLLNCHDKLAIIGKNGSGKTTLIKAIFNDPLIYKTGYWVMPKPSDIGYLDQHYRTLTPNFSVYETIEQIVPLWSSHKIRRHLNDFLFRKNEEVMMPIKLLSGGEKTRLSLAQIAANTPKLLLLDEITNNLDLETKNHVAQILKNYPGAMMVISHDTDFLESINITDIYNMDKII